MKTDKLQRYIFRVQTVMVILLALILGAVGILINLRDESRQRDQNLQNVAEAIAHSDPVFGSAQGEAGDVLIEYLDSLKESLSDIDVISVVGEDNVRLYHTNHDLIGTVFDGTVPDFAATGDYYAVDETGPSGLQRRAYAAIVSEDGAQIGFVMTIMLRTNIRMRTIRILVTFAIVAVLAILLEMLISYRISQKVRNSLMGYEPDTFSAMFNVREDILEVLNEGIIAVNDQAETEYINSAARKMLSGTEKTDSKAAQAETDPAQLSAGRKREMPDRTAAEEAGKKLLEPTLKKREKEVSVPVNTAAGTHIILDRIPVTKNGRVTGAVGILHNRTEYTKLAEDLAGTRFLVDSMRANNHDFTNKLHVILGLLQMEMYDEAMQYIENITIVQRETISEIMHKIGVPAVAALLIGKNARASELNVKFHFQKDSRYNPDDYYVPEDVLVTVIGNLIDNAFDAMNGSADLLPEEKELWFGIYSGPDALLITSDDTGPGISEENIGHIFEYGFSTKGEGRGTGLYQVKKLVEAYGGTISVESQEGSGTSFSVSFGQ